MTLVKHCESSSHLQSEEELKNFFQSSYIAKESGHFQFKPEKNKIYFADGKILWSKNMESFK